MMPIAVIRPQPGCDATVAAARALGLDARGFPLFAVRPVGWDPPDPGEVDALLIGSANALRHGGPALALYREKPVYAVGESTAQAARQQGFAIAAAGTGGLQDLLGSIAPGHRKLLRLSGQTRVEIVPPAKIGLIERSLYASEPAPMPDALAQLLAEPAVVLLHSAEAARHFAAECTARRIARNRIALAALGPRIAAAAGEGWAALAHAAQPSDDALLALAREMCQTADDGPA